MVHCYCSFAPTCSSSAGLSIPLSQRRQPGQSSNHLPSWPGKQSQEQQQTNSRTVSQPGLAANTSRPANDSAVRRRVSTAAHNGKGDKDLPVSLYWPYKNLPPDGKTRLESEELCNPEEKSCQTPMHVIERKCKACCGSGSISSSHRARRRSSFVCTICHGVGFVRYTTSRFMPPEGLNNGSGDYTLGRPVPPPPQEDDRKKNFRNLRR